MLMQMLSMETGLPVDVRIMFISAVFLALAAFVMSGFAAFLFYKFYRDTIMPVPVFQLENRRDAVSLKVYNNGNSTFHIFNCLYVKGGRTTDNVFEFLPRVQDEALFSMFTKGIVGKRLLPDQHFRVFEIDFAFLEGSMTGEQVLAIKQQLEGMTVELFCHDIGRRYKSVTRIVVENLV
jgi:hypothetical protein